MYAHLEGNYIYNFFFYLLFSCLECFSNSAEALETIGCGRIPVQVGRFDAKKANSKSTIINWSNPSSEGIVSAFQTSGLDYKEVALLFGGLGEIQRVVAETLATSGGDDEEEDDEFEKQPFVPTTFGARDAIYGSKMGKGDFGSNYLKSILSNKPPASDVIGKQLAADPKVKSYLAKYATNEPAFKQEIGEAYVKLTLLGSAYTTRNS